MNEYERQSAKVFWKHPKPMERSKHLCFPTDVSYIHTRAGQLKRGWPETAAVKLATEGAGP